MFSFQGPLPLQNISTSRWKSLSPRIYGVVYLTLWCVCVGSGGWRKENSRKSLTGVRLLATPWTPPGSSVHGVLQARILEWVAIPSSRGSSWPRDRTPFSCTAGSRFTLWATGEAAQSNRICVLSFPSLLISVSIVLASLELEII